MSASRLRRHRRLELSIRSKPLRPDTALIHGPRRLRRRRRCLAATALAALPALVLAAPPTHAGELGELRELEAEGVTRIIVKREEDLSRAERTDVRRDAGVSFVRALSLDDTEVVRASRGELAQAVAELRADPDVVYAEPDAPVAAAGPDPLWGDLWGLDNVGQLVNGVQGTADADIDAPEAWQTATGAGTTVAVIDSGVDFAAPDLAGALAVNPGESGDGRETNGIDDDGNGFVDDFRGWDWTGRDNLPEDPYGHGSHVTGIVAARRDNDEGIAGVAPGAQVMPLRILDERGSGYSSAAAEALAYAGRQGYRIVNASLGGPIHVQAIEDAVAAHPDTLYVFAAGNGAYDAAAGAVQPVDIDATPFYPCALPQENVVCVGASTSTDEPAWFSNFGAQAVDLHAPGVFIRSVHLGGYALMNGTSMASPFVAGVAALVASALPASTPAALKQRLLSSAEPRPGLAGRSVTGGRLNAAAALPAAASAKGSGEPPEPSPEAPPGDGATPGSEGEGDPAGSEQPAAGEAGGADDQRDGPEDGGVSPG